VIKNNKILILGGYGFLGSWLYKILKKQNSLHRYGKLSRKQIISSGSLKKIKKNFDIIIHSAGSSSVPESILNPKKDYRKNIGSTQALIKFIKIKKIKPKIVFVSSSAVFGNNIREKLMQPISPYGKNKLKSEQLLIKYAKKNNLKLIIIRFFSLYGEGLKKQLLWDVLCKIKKNNFSFYGTGLEVRSWMHVADAVKVINNALLFSKKNIQIINAPGKAVMTNKEIINKIYKNCHIRTKPIFNKIKRTGDPKILVFNHKDLKKIKMKESINLSFGLKNYIKWFQEK
jgi:UDP-glucose 4-epimerase